MRNSNKKKRAESASRLDVLCPESPFVYSEAYKTLRTNLSFTGVSRRSKRILVTSAVAGEGKSTVSANLAISLAETGAKVLLIDCDLRSPSIHRILRLRGESLKGLSMLLSGEAELKDCLYLHPQYHFHFIAAGTIPPNPSELLSSPNMQELLNVLSERFDYIICDAPPIGIVTDAAVISAYCDGAILVVKQRSTTRNQVRVAKDSLEAVNANILGVVLNQFDLGTQTDGRYSRYHYYDYEYGKK